MKLELKHLAPYLPYKVLVGDGRTPFELTEHNFTNVFPYVTKIYLRPLSDLVKEVEHNGERFVPIDWLNDNKSLKLGICVNTQGEWNIFNGKTSNIRFLEYCVIEKLFEWNFDVFNLIEEGLAIDINTLKP